MVFTVSFVVGDPVSMITIKYNLPILMYSTQSLNLLNNYYQNIVFCMAAETRQSFVRLGKHRSNSLVCFLVEGADRAGFLLVGPTRPWIQGRNQRIYTPRGSWPIRPPLYPGAECTFAGYQDYLADSWK